MLKHGHNKTYKNLKSLVRLFMASVFIIGGLNYIFEIMIEDLNQQTKNLEIKKMLENKISSTLVSARENISDFLVLEPNQKNQNYFKNKLNDKLTQIKYIIEILKKGGIFKLDNTLEKNIYKPESYGIQDLNFNKLTLTNLNQSVSLFLLFLNKISETISIDKLSYITELNYLIKEIKNNNNNMITQTNYQLNRVKNDIEIKTQQYTGYELLAIIFVIASLLYVSNIISNQILKNSDNIESAKKEAQRMAIKAKQANLAKSEFLANMSHEIRTPLNAILGFIDLLKDKESDSEKLKYISTVQSSSNSLLGIINDILDFSKIESGNLQIEKINFNTEDEFDSLADLFRAKASEKSISLTVNLDPNMPSALINDPLRIKQVISNLLSNAIKFTDKNGRVQLNINYENNNLHVGVQDDGIGIAKDKQSNIFKAFTQAENSTTRQYGGTGLGLTISSKLIKILGGELKLHSQLNIGSKFYFSIPTEVGTYKSSRLKEKIDGSALKGKHILVVEDNRANQMFMSLVLKKFSITFEIANDGLEAIDCFKNKKYALILMDENMPRLNGIEATKRILKIENEKNLIHTPIVALTANALKGDRERFIEAGMDEYLTKPVNKDKLLTILSKLIDTREEKAC